MTRRRMILAPLTLLLAQACASGYLADDNYLGEESEFRIAQDAEILDSPQNRDVLDVLAGYRRALVSKDFGSIQRYVAPDYYDNASTTSTTRDDYGRDDLEKVLEMLAKHAEQIQYRVTVRDLRVDRADAYIDYEFRYAYEFVVGDERSWDAGVEVNRLELKRRDGVWRIVSGL